MLLEKISNMVKYFKKSGNNTKLQEKGGLKLLQDVITRSGSTYIMVRRVIDCKPHLIPMLSEIDWNNSISEMSGWIFPNYQNYLKF